MAGGAHKSRDTHVFRRRDEVTHRRVVIVATILAAIFSARPDMIYE